MKKVLLPKIRKKLLSKTYTRLGYVQSVTANRATYTFTLTEKRRNIKDWILTSVVSEDGTILFPRQESDTKETIHSRTPYASGYIYVLRRENNKSWYKIGLTIDINKRVYALEQEFGTLSIELLFKVESMLPFERNLHATFREKNIYNEWFALDDEDLSYLEQTFSSLLVHV